MIRITPYWGLFWSPLCLETPGFESSMRACRVNHGSFPMSQGVLMLRPMIPRNVLWPLQSGPLASVEGSELWAAILNVAYNGVIMVLQRFRVRGAY